MKFLILAMAFMPSFGLLGASRKRTAAGGGGGPSFPDDTTSANEYLILFI